MKQELQVYELRKDKELRNSFIKENENFIRSSASKALGRYVDKDDDAYSIALIAFDEAISKFDSQKGGFFRFASLLIKNRLIDELRRTDTKTIPFSRFAHTGDHGEIEGIEIVGELDVASDAALELAALKEELARYNIRMFDIPKATPKSKKTKEMMGRVLAFIMENETARDSILCGGVIPSKLILKNTDANKKFLERHRKYMIAVTVILNGDYPVVRQYVKEVSR